jgi:hypothetical protein
MGSVPTTPEFDLAFRAAGECSRTAARLCGDEKWAHVRSARGLVAWHDPSLTSTAWVGKRSSLEGLVKDRSALLPYRPSDIAGLLAPLSLLNEEVLVVVYINARGLHAGEDLLSGGTASSVGTRYRLLFESAFRRGASGIILIHNHPSGSPQPSQHDLASTRSLEALAVPMEIRLVDHLIVGARAVFSMRAAGLLSQ